MLEFNVPTVAWILMLVTGVTLCLAMAYTGYQDHQYKQFMACTEKHSPTLCERIVYGDK